jgi:hypothetical protein
VPPSISARPRGSRCRPKRSRRQPAPSQPAALRGANICRWRVSTAVSPSRRRAQVATRIGNLWTQQGSHVRDLRFYDLHSQGSPCRARAFVGRAYSKNVLSPLTGPKHLLDHLVATEADTSGPCLRTPRRKLPLSLCPVGRTTSATGRGGRHSAALTDTSMSACATSSPDGIRWQGVAHAGSPWKLSTGNSACCVSNACPSMPRRGPHGETSRRAGCRKSACPFR